MIILASEVTTIVLRVSLSVELTEIVLYLFHGEEEIQQEILFNPYYVTKLIVQSYCRYILVSRTKLKHVAFFFARISVRR